MDILNAHNSAVVNRVRLQFHTSTYGTIMKQLLHENASFSMTDFGHGSTLFKNCMSQKNVGWEQGYLYKGPCKYGTLKYIHFFHLINSSKDLLLRIKALHMSTISLNCLNRSENVARKFVAHQVYIDLRKKTFIFYFNISGCFKILETMVKGTWGRYQP